MNRSINQSLPQPLAQDATRRSPHLDAAAAAPRPRAEAARRGQRRVRPAWWSADRGLTIFFSYPSTYLYIHHFESICLSVFPFIYLQGCFYVTDSTVVQAQMRASKRKMPFGAKMNVISARKKRWLVALIYTSQTMPINWDHHPISIEDSVKKRNHQAKATWEWAMQHVLRDTPSNVSRHDMEPNRSGFAKWSYRKWHFGV